MRRNPRWPLIVVLAFDSAMRGIAGSPPAPARMDYSQPSELTATIYDPVSKNLLFRFRRTATNSGPTVRVLREDPGAGNALAAREQIVYTGDRLESIAIDDFQNTLHGCATVQRDDHQTNLVFDCTMNGKRKTAREIFDANTLNADMVGPFLVRHWDDLQNGAVLKCRLIALTRAETVGFKVFKDSDAIWQKKPVILVTMEPGSFIIARFVEPLHFVVEKAPSHRVLQYTGRTTPTIQRKGRWEDLDALTIFDWH